MDGEINDKQPEAPDVIEKKAEQPEEEQTISNTEENGMVSFFVLNDSPVVQNVPVKRNSSRK